MAQGTCSICGTVDDLRRGWCTKHYKRWRKYGDPLGSPAPKAREPDLPGEHWAPVPSYEGLYEASDLGRVYSLPRMTASGIRGGGILQPWPDGSSGYLAVGLFREASGEKWAVHQLILLAFVGPCPPGQWVRHGRGGGDKFDNRLANLEYGTPSENMGPDRVRDDTDLHGERAWMARLTDEIVIECRQRYVAGENQVALALEFGVSPAAMGNAVTGKTWKHLPGAGEPRRRRGLNSAKTHCPKNHPYSGDNLYIAPSGGRMCRICRRDSHHRRGAAAKLAA